MLHKSASQFKRELVILNYLIIKWKHKEISDLRSIILVERVRRLFSSLYCLNANKCYEN